MHANIYSFGDICKFMLLKKGKISKKQRLKNCQCFDIGKIFVSLSARSIVMDTFCKIKRYLLLSAAWLFCATAAQADGQTTFLGLSLGMSPADMMSQLIDKGLQQESSRELSGRIAGLDVWLTIEPNRDSTGCNHLMLTTRRLQNLSQREDYELLMRWMRKHYGGPQWEATVRSHRFARWFVGFDRDIVMISTASSAVQIWYYNNHETRNIDYYSILKYCERNPASGIPAYTARECVVWKSKTPVVASKKKTVGRKRRASHRRSSARHRRRRR